MVKVRNFWIHKTSIRLSLNKIPKKDLFQFFIPSGYIIFLFKHRKYNQALRHYLYNDNPLYMCAAGPLHSSNGALKKLIFFEFLEKNNLKYLYYNLAFLKK